MAGIVGPRSVLLALPSVPFLKKETRSAFFPFLPGAQRPFARAYSRWICRQHPRLSRLPRFFRSRIAHTPDIITVAVRSAGVILPRKCGPRQPGRRLRNMDQFIDSAEV